MLVVYHNNRNRDWLNPNHPGMTIMVVRAESIIKADKEFKEQALGLDPDKNPWIGRELRFED